MKKANLLWGILLSLAGYVHAAVSSVVTHPAASSPTASKPAAVPMPPIPTPPAPEVVRVLLVPDRETILGSTMNGRLLELSPRVGDPVRKGQVVARFDCTEPFARRDMARSELQSARLSHEAKIRLQGLQSAAELDVELAASAVAKAQAQLGVAKAQLTQCSVEAPFSGRVVKWHAKPFQGVNLGMPLIEIVSDASPRIKVNVPSRWLRWLKAGTRFDINIEETGKRYHAHVRQLNARIDPVSQSIEVEAAFSGSVTDVLPGMSGTALFDVRP